MSHKHVGVINGSLEVPAPTNRLNLTDLGLRQLRKALLSPGNTAENCMAKTAQKASFIGGTTRADGSTRIVGISTNCFS